jgi:hypothetical protein
MTDEASRPQRFLSEARSLDLADPVVNALTRNVLNVFFEMQKLSKVGLSRVVAADFDDSGPSRSDSGVSSGAPRGSF